MNHYSTLLKWNKTPLFYDSCRLKTWSLEGQPYQSKRYVFKEPSMNKLMIKRTETIINWYKVHNFCSPKLMIKRTATIINGYKVHNFWSPNGTRHYMAHFSFAPNKPNFRTNNISIAVTSTTSVYHFKATTVDKKRKRTHWNWSIPAVREGMSHSDPNNQRWKYTKSDIRSDYTQPGEPSKKQTIYLQYGNPHASKYLFRNSKRVFPTALMANVCCL